MPCAQGGGLTPTEQVKWGSTDVHTTEATVPDVKVASPVQQCLAEHNLKPTKHYLDAGCPSADRITDVRKQGITMVTPLLRPYGHQPRRRPVRRLLRRGQPGPLATAPEPALHKAPISPQGRGVSPYACCSWSA